MIGLEKNYSNLRRCCNKPRCIATCYLHRFCTKYKDDRRWKPISYHICDKMSGFNVIGLEKNYSNLRRCCNKPRCIATCYLHRFCTKYKDDRRWKPISYHICDSRFECAVYSNIHTKELPIWQLLRLGESGAQTLQLLAACSRVLYGEDPGGSCLWSRRGWVCGCG